MNCLKNWCNKILVFVVLIFSLNNIYVASHQLAVGDFPIAAQQFDVVVDKDMLLRAVHSPLLDDDVDVVAWLDSPINVIRVLNWGTDGVRAFASRFLRDDHHCCMGALTFVSSSAGACIIRTEVLSHYFLSGSMGLDSPEAAVVLALANRRLLYVPTRCANIQTYSHSERALVWTILHAGLPVDPDDLLYVIVHIRNRLRMCGNCYTNNERDALGAALNEHWSVYNLGIGLRAIYHVPVYIDIVYDMPIAGDSQRHYGFETLNFE